MPQATLTIVTEVVRSEELGAALLAFQAKVAAKNVEGDSGGPFAHVRGLHFARFAMINGDDKRGLAPQLVFAMVFDGAPRDCARHLVENARQEIDAIYAHCVGYNAANDSQRIDYLLRAHCKAALWYQGTEDLDLGTIKAMPHIRDGLRSDLDQTMAAGGAAESEFSLALEARRTYSTLSQYNEHVRLPRTQRKSRKAIKRRTALWVLTLFVEAALVSFLAVPLAFAICHIIGCDFRPWMWAFMVLPLGLPALELCRRELVEAWKQHGQTVELSDQHLRSVVAEEDIAVQNALTHCVIVDGLFRRVILCIVFWVLGQRVSMVDSLAGSLGGITSIHFGRWILIDKGKSARRLVFLSDYDGSWESYLGEFVDRAAKGLTAVWSNTERFPPTRLLVWKGAKDELKFKAWTRANQVNTQVYYSAYPHVTLRNIENNLRIVRGATSEPAPPREPVWLESL